MSARVPIGVLKGVLCVFLWDPFREDMMCLSYITQNNDMSEMYPSAKAQCLLGSWESYIISF